jgi:predicted N-acetyltransferase YhbS
MQMVELVPLLSIKPHAVEALLDAAFGSDRHSRTAYLLRAGSSPLSALSFAITCKEQLLASIQCWPVSVAGFPLVLVGPVAVNPHHQNSGHGRTLMHAMLDAASKIGDPAMVMIGDPEYYERFGFNADSTAGWTLPGPWEPRRLLARNVAGHALPETGMLERANAL